MFPHSDTTTEHARFGVRSVDVTVNTTEPHESTTYQVSVNGIACSEQGGVSKKTEQQKLLCASVPNKNSRGNKLLEPVP